MIMEYLVPAVRASAYLAQFGLDLEELIASGRIEPLRVDGEPRLHVEDLALLTWSLETLDIAAAQHGRNGNGGREAVA